MSQLQHCPAISNRRPFGVADTAYEPFCLCEFDVPHYRSYLCLPLVSRGRLLGLVSLAGLSPAWSAASRAWAEVYASQLACGLAAQERLSQAERQAMVDDLTQLYNRRFTEEYIRRLLALSARSPHPFALLMLDIDHFKAFNDRFGHMTGDRVLHILAAAVVREVRQSAVVARWGGDEFTIVLPDVVLDSAQRIAERVRIAVERIRLEEPLSRLPLTVSIGIAAFPFHGSNLHELLDAVDRALYRAKGAGRNCTEVAAGVLSRV